MEKFKRYILSLLPYSTKKKIVYQKGHGFSSADYWDKRYQQGGDSGFGSYGEYASFKAEIINTIVEKHSIETVIELGCGDGNQTSLFQFPYYIGLDVSERSIVKCREKFKGDKRKEFGIYSPETFLTETNYHNNDLSMSLDVIYHLVEDDVFDVHMRDLFLASKKYVLIYSSDTNQNENLQSIHVRHRKFSDWIANNQPDWELIEEYQNRVDQKNPTINYIHSSKIFLYRKRSSV